MSVTIDWLAFLQVFAAALIGAADSACWCAPAGRL